MRIKDQGFPCPKSDLDLDADLSVFQINTRIVIGIDWHCALIQGVLFKIRPRLTQKASFFISYRLVRYEQKPGLNLILSHLRHVNYEPPQIRSSLTSARRATIEIIFPLQYHYFSKADVVAAKMGSIPPCV